MAEQSSTLRVGVDSRDMETGARKGEQALDRLGQKAKTTETQFQRLQSQVGGIKTAFAAIGVGVAVREFARLLDVTTTIDNRLRLVTTSTAQLNAVYDQLFRISNDTRSSLQANADMFNRVSQAVSGTGKSYNDVLAFTEQINQAMAISGTSGEAAAAGIYQLGQALATGKLSGDEFVSVNETMPRVMQAVADSLGVPRGALKDLAKEGKLTADVLFQAMSDAAPALAEEFGKITPTIASAFTVLNNHILNFVRDVNAASGIGEIFAGVIMFVANNFNAFAGAAAGLAIVIGGVLLQSIAAMTVALAANPIGLVVVAIAAATAAIGAFGSMTVTVGGQTVTVWQTIKAAVMTVIDGVKAVYNGVVSLFSGMSTAASPFFQNVGNWLKDFVGWWASMFSTVLGWMKAAINTYIGLYVGLVSAIGPTITEGIPALFKLAMALAVNAVIQGAENIVNIFAKALGGIAGALDYIPGLEGTGDKIRAALTVDLSGAKVEVEGYKAAVTSAGSAISDAFTGAQVDYVGAFGQAVSGAAGVVKDQFNTNLSEVVKTQEASANLNDIIGGGLNNTVTPALNSAGGAAGGAAKAMDDLNKEMKEFTDNIDQEFARIQEANGGAVASVEAWYQEQKAKLVELGLAYTDYATKLEVIFKDKMAEAYKTDLENATDWRSGIERAVQGLGESIGDESDLAETALTSIFNNAASAIANFAKTGKLDFKEFARSVAADILMLTTKMLLLKALKGILGFSDGGVAGGGGGDVLQLASGGYLSGPGSGTSDSIPAMLSNGEFVVNAKATEQFLPLLNAINSGKSIKLASGGMSSEGGSLATPPAPKQGVDSKTESSDNKQQGRNLTIIPTISGSDIVNTFDSDEGDRVLVNMLERNRTTIRGILQ